jgi:site-specific recombinase XerD
LTVNGKGRKRRFVPLNTTALETVQTAIQFSKSRHAFYQVCLKLAKTSGCLPFGPHSLRHYFATQCLAKGVEIHRLSKILGHSSVAVTERYYHFSPEHLAGLTDCLNEDL